MLRVQRSNERKHVGFAIASGIVAITVFFDGHDISYQLTVISYQLTVNSYQLSIIVHCSLLIVNCSLLIVYRL